MDPEYDEGEAEWFINLKKSKQAMDDQREDDLFDDWCTYLESDRVMCICCFPSMPP